MSWGRVLAGLEALGTGAATPRPAASFVDALSVAGRIVAAPTQSKRAFDEQALEDAAVLGDEHAVNKITTDPAPPPPLDLLKKWVSYTKKLDSRGDYVGTGHKRIAIPKTNLSEGEIKRLGFQSVLAGIPETGQDRFRSLRRVDSNHHLHSHPDYWTLHEDEHPSMTMALQKAEGPLAATKAVVSGTSHVVGEGMPGAYYYLKGQLLGGDGMVDRLGRLARIRKKRVKLAGLSITIDRPKGFEKVFPTPAGPVKKQYPVDYGYFEGFTNPDDGEGADVFVGDGSLNGRFMKGKNLSGSWEPDERKWFMNLTPDQLSAVKEMFTSQSPDLLRDEIQFADQDELARDLASLQAKTAVDRLHDLLCPFG